MQPPELCDHGLRQRSIDRVAADIVRSNAFHAGEVQAITATDPTARLDGMEVVEVCRPSPPENDVIVRIHAHFSSLRTS
jgi:hypothetical protein